MAKDEKDNVNAGHRARMWKRYLEHGITGFQDHEALEVLLYFMIPRSDTNKTAHRLLNEFGTISRVMCASEEELCNVEGIGPKTAKYIRYSNDFFFKKGIEPYHNPKEKISLADFKDRRNLFMDVLRGEKDEKFYIASLDDEMHLIRYFLAAEGTPGHVDLSPQLIVRKILAEHCNQVIVAHNHPNGSPQPSYDDIAMTNALADLLNRLDIRLIDHIIVAGRYSISMANSGYYKMPFSP